MNEYVPAAALRFAFSAGTVRDLDNQFSVGGGGEAADACLLAFVRVPNQLSDVKTIER